MAHIQFREEAGEIFAVVTNKNGSTAVVTFDSTGDLRNFAHACDRACRAFEEKARNNSQAKAEREVAGIIAHNAWEAGGRKGLFIHGCEFHGNAISSVLVIGGPFDGGEPYRSVPGVSGRLSDAFGL